MATLRVRESFAALKDPTSRISYAAGELVDSDHWAAKNFPQHFEPVEDYVSARATRGTVEQATAAPGEKRSRSAAKKTD